MKDFLKKNWVFITLTLLVIINSGWLIFKGMPFQHDIEFHYSRIISLANTIKNGDFFALIHDAFYGYGYALGIFYGNLFFYIPSLLYIIGLPDILVFKLFYILINIGTVIITYFSMKGIIKNKKISVFITILYCLSEYRLIDVFVRGAVGEMLAFMVAPLIIYGIYEIIYGDCKKWYLFTIGFVLILLSHLISTVLMVIFCSIIILFNIKRFWNEKCRIKYLIISVIVGILLGAFFIFPILEQYLLSEISIFVDGSVYYPTGLSILNLVIPSKLFSYYLGVSIILLIPIRFFVKKKNIDKNDYKLLSFSNYLFILGVIAWMFTSDIFPWKYLGNMFSFIQFPWRLLFIATLFLSFSIGINIYLLYKNGHKKIVDAVFKFIIIASLITIGLYSVQYGIRKNHYNTFTTNEIGNGEYLLSNTDLFELKNKVYGFNTNNDELIFDYSKKGTKVVINYSNNLTSDTYIEIPLFNYLGYDINSNLKVENGTNDFMKIYLEDENGSFEIYYKGTSIQKISYIISFITGVSFIGFLIVSHRKGN